MSREHLLALSRRASELELEARRLRHGSGIVDALGAVQTAIARRLDRIEAAEREGQAVVARQLDATTVLGRYREHLQSAGHGAQARLARRTGIAGTTLSKFFRRGRIGEHQLGLLSAALDQIEREERPR